MAERVGVLSKEKCPNCSSLSGHKLSKRALIELSDHFFVDGSYHFCNYGCAPVIMRSNHPTEEKVSISPLLSRDFKMLCRKAGISFFYYGPAVWKVGATEWNTQLSSCNSRVRIKAVIALIDRCASRRVQPGTKLFRLRKDVFNPSDLRAFDAPERQKPYSARFNIRGKSVLYTSLDVETCLHESRVSIEDEVYVATLTPKRSLFLLDVTRVSSSKEEKTEFESLPIAIAQVFAAGKHSYRVTRTLAKCVMEKGYDGIIYPSYYNRVRSKPHLNIVLFGRAINEDLVEVLSIDRVILNKVHYSFDFGPALDNRMNM